MSDVGEQVARTSSQAMQALAKFLMKMFEYMQKKSADKTKYAQQIAMAKWIGEGNTAYTYQVQGPITGEMQDQLDKAGIPNMSIVTKKLGRVFLVKDCDLDRINEINRQILVARSDYYQEVGARELENAIANSEAVKNKELLKISDLSYAQMHCLRNKCNDISRGFMVGITRHPDEEIYDLVVTAPKVCEYDPEKTDFCEAALRASFSLAGPNMETKVNQITSDAAMDKKIAELKDADGSHFLVSEGNPSRYIQFDTDQSTNEFSFRFYEQQIGKDGQLHYELKQAMSSNDPDFNVELVRCTDRFKNKIILDDQTQLQQHLDGTLKQSTDREKKTKDQRKISDAETEFTDKINVMIKDRYFKDGNNEGLSTIKKFNLYRGEVSNIANALESEITPPGYEGKDMKELKDILGKAGISIADYRDAIDMLKDMDAITYTAEKQQYLDVIESQKKMDQVITKEGITPEDIKEARD